MCQGTSLTNKLRGYSASPARSGGLRRAVLISATDRPTFDDTGGAEVRFSRRRGARVTVTRHLLHRSERPVIGARGVSLMRRQDARFPSAAPYLERGGERRDEKDVCNVRRPPWRSLTHVDAERDARPTGKQNRRKRESRPPLFFPPVARQYVAIARHPTRERSRERRPFLVAASSPTTTAPRWTVPHFKLTRAASFRA